MNILFLTDNFPPEVNASASRVFERACHWVKWGHQVTVITCFPNFPEGKIFSGYKNKLYQVEYIQGIKVIRVKTFITANEGFLLRTIDFVTYMFSAFIAGLFEKKHDVVVATSPQFFTAVSGWLLGMFKSIPFIFELGDIWPATIFAVGAMKKNFLFNLLEKFELFLYRQSKLVIALTNAFKNNLIARGISADKITVVINGVEVAKYTKQPRNLELAQQYNLENAFVVGYIGTHGMAHGLENVLACAMQLEYEKNIQFIFVGAGAQKEMLRKIAQTQAIKNVQFIPLQPKEKINAFWGLCDIALVHLKNDPTFAEVIPSKIFEAMAVGLPILLAAPKGEASAIIENEQVGIWVPPENPTALAGAILKLYQANNIREQLANTSLATAVKYSRETQAKKMLAAIEKVV